MKYKFVLVAALLLSSGFIACKDGGHDPEPNPVVISSESPVEGVRIAWDHASLRKLSPASSGYSGYARMIRLRNGNLFCVFENDGKIQKTVSTDDGNSWGTAVTIAEGETMIGAAVPEILQLADNSLLLSYNMRPNGSADPSRRFAIRTKRSTNDGVDWSEAVTVYQAGHEFANGCWEPAQIQLPSGEIQMYIANEGPYTSSNEQEITMFRSADNGVNWTAGEKVSFRAGHRDGMPVPLILEDKNEIIFAIEDNGIAPTEFKPAIIRTTLTNNWSNAPVSATSSDREQPLDEQNRIAGTKYAGAPYIRRIASGEVILSYQSNEFRQDNIWDRSDMVVSVGDDDGRNFNRKSIPFYFTDKTRSCLWNSLSVTDENTVWAVGTCNAYGNKSEVWIIKGHVSGNLEASNTTLTLDGNASESLWSSPRQLFVGGYGQTNLNLWSSWDNDMLYFAVRVNDLKVNAGGINVADGFKIYLDPTGKSVIAPDKQIYALGVSASGAITFQQGSAARWVDESATGIVVKTKTDGSGYVAEIAIPWGTLGGKPPLNKRIGLNACLYESADGSKHVYEEGVAGNILNAPYSWSTMLLK